MTNHVRQIQAAFRQFTTTEGWHAPHGATLTLKQGRQIEAATGQSYQAITPLEASKNLRDFLNRLNQHVYGNAAKRHAKRVPVIPVIEGGDGKRLHYHLIIDCPRDDLKTGYCNLLTTLWQETPWGYKINEINPKVDGGWTKYISKIRDKPNYADSIDWSNCHLIDRRD